jgi:alpha-ketoglutarate-dependent taurine dioxygenase
VPGLAIDWTEEDTMAPTSAISIEPATTTVGAVVTGVDHDRMLNDQQFPAWCLDALEAHGVLVFRGLNLDDPTQVAFSKKLGRVEVFGKGELPEIFRVTLDPAKNRAAEYLKGTVDWHIDGLTEEVPIMATLLTGHVIAASGGETEFASSYAAYEDLSDAEKDRFAQVRVVHSLEAAARLITPDPTPEQVELWRRRPPKEHPLVWTHRSGRRSLVLGSTMDHVAGMELAEGRALLNELLERSTRPERVYQHSWQVGDLVIWDNRGVLHRVLAYDASSGRDMHRTTLYGDEAIG